MKTTAKIQKTKSNTTVNIPRSWADFLGLGKGQKVELELKNGKILVSKKED